VASQHTDVTQTQTIPTQNTITQRLHKTVSHSSQETSDACYLSLRMWQVMLFSTPITASGNIKTKPDIYV